MLAIADLVRPIQNAVAVSRKGEPLSLGDEILIGGKEGLAKIRASYPTLLAEIAEHRRQIVDAPEPFLGAMLADRLVEMYENEEEDVASKLKQMRSLFNHRWDQRSLAYLRDMRGLLIDLAEMKRDARWALMAMAAERRHENDILPEMSISDLRKLVTR